MVRRRPAQANAVAHGVGFQPASRRSFHPAKRAHAPADQPKGSVPQPGLAFIVHCKNPENLPKNAKIFEEFSRRVAFLRSIEKIATRRRTPTLRRCYRRQQQLRRTTIVVPAHHSSFSHAAQISTRKIQTGFYFPVRNRSRKSSQPASVPRFRSS